MEMEPTARREKIKLKGISSLVDFCSDACVVERSWAPLSNLTPVAEVLENPTSWSAHPRHKTLPPLLEKDCNYPFGTWDWRNNESLKRKTLAVKELEDPDLVECIVLETHSCKAVICPRLGGRLLNLVDKETGQHLIHFDFERGFNPIRCGSCRSGWVPGGIVVCAGKPPHAQNIMPASAHMGSNKEACWARVADVDIYNGTTWVSEYYLGVDAGVQLVQRITICPASVGDRVEFSILANVPWRDMNSQIILTPERDAHVSTRDGTCSKTTRSEDPCPIPLDTLHSVKFGKKRPRIQLAGLGQSRAKSLWSKAKRETFLSPSDTSQGSKACFIAVTVPTDREQEDSPQEIEPSAVNLSQSQQDERPTPRSGCVGVIWEERPQISLVQLAPVRLPGQDVSSASILICGSFQTDIYIQHRSFDFVWGALPALRSDATQQVAEKSWASRYQPSLSPQKVLTLFNLDDFMHCPYRREWLAFLSSDQQAKLPKTPPPPRLLQAFLDRYRHDQSPEMVAAICVASYHSHKSPEECWKPIIQTADATVLIETIEPGVPTVSFLERANLPPELWRIAGLFYWKLHSLLPEATQAFLNAREASPQLKYDALCWLELDQLLQNQSETKRRQLLLDDEAVTCDGSLQPWIALERKVSLLLHQGRPHDAKSLLLCTQWPQELHRTVRSSLYEAAHHAIKCASKLPTNLQQGPFKYNIAAVKVLPQPNAPYFVLEDRLSPFGL